MDGGGIGVEKSPGDGRKTDGGTGLEKASMERIADIMINMRVMAC